MDQTRIVVSGGLQLSGEVNIQGSKNATQKILPATLVFPGKYDIHNVPRIEDSEFMIRILKYLGADVVRIGTNLRIDTIAAVEKEISPELASLSTGSFLFAGALLSRHGYVKVWHPGGDAIGQRSVAWHLDAFRQLGATVIEHTGYYEITGKHLSGASIKFEQKTVNGSVNALLAAVRANGRTIIKNVPSDPDIENFRQFFNTAGAKIEWGSDDSIVVEGVIEGKSHTEAKVIPDRNDAATFLIISALTHGPIRLKGVIRKHLEPLLSELLSRGVTYDGAVKDDTEYLDISCDRINPPGLQITSHPYPGFSTDWGPMTQVLMTQIPAVSTFHETIFSKRFGHLPEIMKMGADIDFYNPEISHSVYHFPYDANAGLYHAVRIKGSTRLHGASVEAGDVRAGAALVTAALIADGTTTITGAEHVLRGYDSFVERLRSLGATISIR